MAETLRCPKCSSESILSNREGDRHACETCGHKFTTAKPHATLRIFLSYVRSLVFQLATRLPNYRKLLLTLPEIAELDLSQRLPKSEKADGFRYG